MIDIAPKKVTERVAKAHGVVRLSEKTLRSIERGEVPKGDVLAVARVAGIMAAKETSRILPLCHPIPLESVDVEFTLRHRPTEIEVRTTARATWKTGVEMEALAAAAAAALTIYDMCKSLERGITLERLELAEKRGGRSGIWVRRS
ncbi:MAG TPA: cyclic pyranopterin monophosphate synthase MoaC [Bdellovibrionota bacterium]|nr:cyclic pyranopterin monophosphate synthase MoaC [Bdellovibrionota bacterium]